MKAYDIGFVCLSGGVVVVDNNDDDGGDDDENAEDDSSCKFLLTAYNVTKWVLIK